MKQKIKNQIIKSTLEAKERNESAIANLKRKVSLDEYSHLTYESEFGTIWTKALQRAICENEIVIIPKSDHIYWLDSTIIIPSNRHIEATGATIRLVPSYPYVMIRNEHVQDGTHAPIDTSNRDYNISIHGGRWEESSTQRGFRPCAETTKNSFVGVQCCMLFNNICGLTMQDVTFANTKSFSVQVGDLIDGVFENFFFVSCYADGLHINGNSENLYISNFRGHVGDDLVALNMYDWIGSSINYGPAKNVFCENIHSAPDSHAKAMRLQPGIFAFKDGTKVDCSLENMYFKDMSGIFEYKLYFQSPPYKLGEKPEGEGAGSANNLFFENIHIVSQRTYYPDDNEITGHFGMFFINSNVGYLSLENIHYFTNECKSPLNHLIAVGPMSWRAWGGEVFDPYISGTLDTLELENIYVDEKEETDVSKLIKIIQLDDVNKDGFSSGKGTLNHIIINGKIIK